MVFVEGFIEGFMDGFMEARALHLKVSWGRFH
jgi:hypothetical protein